MTQDEQDRLNDIEIRFTYQARLIDELNDELIAANGRIELLERDVSRLREMMTRLAPDLEDSPDE